MGIISIEKADHLFWLGRYAERVFTTLDMFFKCYDEMIDRNGEMYKIYCEKIAIPDIYGSKEVFVEKYLTDPSDPNSVYSNLVRAYDNAVVCRDEISSASLSYIEMSLTALRRSGSYAPIFEMQKVTDYLYAFWGSVDDCVENEECRNLMKCGRYVERLDLYMRLDYPYPMIEREFSKFLNRLRRVGVRYNLGKLDELTAFINQKEKWTEHYNEALNCLAAVFE